MKQELYYFTFKQFDYFGQEPYDCNGFLFNTPFGYLFEINDIVGEEYFTSLEEFITFMKKRYFSTFDYVELK